MIALHNDYLLFQLLNGESVPCSPEMISVEVTGTAAILIDPDILRHAAASVFHYFKVELEREAVTVGEFSHALEKVLINLGCELRAGEAVQAVSVADLGNLAREAGSGLELFFFPRLRDELRSHLRHSPEVVEFRGLRVCVKQIAGVRRWNRRCEQLQDQIVEFLRQCLNSDAEKPACALVVK